MALNSVSLIGNLGSKPEVKSVGQGTTVASFRLATTESYTKNGEKIDETEWHNVVVWNKAAENCGKYLDKGSKVFVQGKIKTQAYDKEGEQRYITKIIAQRVLFLDTKKSATAPSPSYDPTIDEIPF